MGSNYPGSGAPVSSGLPPNVAAGLSYLVGFISGIIFLVIEGRQPFVRFAAMQSILLSVGYVVISIVLGVFIGFLAMAHMWFLIYPLSALIRLALLALWLWVMVRAFQGQKVFLPIIGAIAERFSQSV